MKVIVGLGNPGTEYEHSRHNTGFLVIDVLSEKYHIPLTRREPAFLVGSGTIDGQDVILVKPRTFMNRSGRAVKRLVESRQVSLKDLIVIQDDLDLEFGRIKIKDGGGDGGHKGVRSIIEALGSGEFVRVRVGIGRPPSPDEATEYVLDSFSGEQRMILKDVLRLAQRALEVILKEGVQAAMNQFHQPV